MKRQLMAFLLLALPLAAQVEPLVNSPKPAPPVVQKLIPLKYADPNTVANLLRIFEANIISNTEMHALAVRATPQSMQAIEEAVARLDTPAAAPKDIDLTIHLLVGTDSEGNIGGPTPRDMESVVTQLKNSFPFKNYRQLDLMTLRTRTGQRAGTESSGGFMQFGTVIKPVVTSFSLNSSSVGADGTTIRLDQIRSNTRIPVEMQPGNFSFQELTLNTDLDIKEGQKVVMGRMGINREQALFLVLTARLVQ
jgi:hypothetical protein